MRLLLVSHQPPLQGGRSILNEATGQQSVKDTAGVTSRGRSRQDSMPPKEQSRQKKSSALYLGLPKMVGEEHMKKERTTERSITLRKSG